MKPRYLYVLRHASAESFSDRGDRGRALSIEGSREATRLGQFLASHLTTHSATYSAAQHASALPAITALRCSPALRTRQTAELLCAEIARAEIARAEIVRAGGASSPERGFPPEPTLVDDMYAASGARLLACVRALPAEARGALLCAHMPGVAELCQLLTAQRTTSTSLSFGSLSWAPATLVGLALPVAAWDEVSTRCGAWFLHRTPRGAVQR